MNRPASFQGFAEPPENSNPDADSWEARILALGSHYPSIWARYGPYSSVKTASKASVKARNVGEGLEDFDVESVYGEVEDGMYVFLRAQRRERADAQIAPLFGRSEGA